MGCEEWREIETFRSFLVGTQVHEPDASKLLAHLSAPSTLHGWGAGVSPRHATKARRFGADKIQSRS
jgi:hypothetical protein